jgi:hypothetical protein
MSLVVAKIIGTYIQIESDSKLTAEDQIHKNPYLFGALKTIIVNNNICISFAGLVNDYLKTALEYIFKLQQVNATLSITDTLGILMDTHNKSNHETDFIIGHQNGKNPELIKIQKGTVCRNSKDFWIGDIDGFNAFQKAFLSVSMKKELSNEEKSALMYEAFAKVINDETIESVDGLIVGALSSNGYFEYKNGINLDIHTITTIKPKEKKVLPFGSAADGSFGLAYFSSEKDSPHAIAIYFPHGKMGILYAPQLSLQKLFIKDVSDNEFLDLIYKEHGIKLRGFIVDLEKGTAKYIGEKPGKFKIDWSIEYKTKPSGDSS